MSSWFPPRASAELDVSRVATRTQASARSVARPRIAQCRALQQHELRSWSTSASYQLLLRPKMTMSSWLPSRAPAELDEELDATKSSTRTPPQARSGPHPRIARYHALQQPKLPSWSTPARCQLLLPPKMTMSSWFSPRAPAEFEEELDATTRSTRTPSQARSEPHPRHARHHARQQPGLPSWSTPERCQLLQPPKMTMSSWFPKRAPAELDVSRFATRTPPCARSVPHPRIARCFALQQHELRSWSTSASYQLLLRPKMTMSSWLPSRAPA